MENKIQPLKRRFKKIYIEITNRCNLACSFCPQGTRPPRTMSVPEFAHILEQISPWTDYIYLHVKGEPLLHPQLGTFLSMAAKAGLQTNITTNGTLLSKAEDILCTSPVRQVNISLHSFEGNANSHALTDNAEFFRQYITRVIHFAQRFSPEHGITSLRLWNLNRNDFTQSMLTKNQFILEQLRQAYALHMPASSELTQQSHSQQSIKLAPKTFLNFDYEFMWPSLSAPDFGSHGSCYGLRHQLAVLCDGTVVPCCLDGNGIIDLGNIFNVPLKTILESTRSQTIIHGFCHQRITEDLCRRCGYRTRFM